MDVPRLKQVRLCLHSNIKDTPVLNRLLASGHIPEDKAVALKAQYHAGNHQTATEQLLDILIGSQQPGIVQALTDALEAEGYKFLAELLQFKEEVRPDEHDRGKQILRLYRPYLSQAFNVMEVVDRVFSKGMINENDKEKVMAFYSANGNGMAVEELLDRVCTKKSSKEWYCAFLESLIEAGSKHIVEEIEPDFLDNPNGFAAQYDQICRGFPSTCSVTSSPGKSAMCQPENDGTKEHLDYYESDASLNNLSPPSAKCEGFDLSPQTAKCEYMDNSIPLKYESQEAEGFQDQQSYSSADEAKVSNLLPNLVVANIKPEVADKTIDNVSSKSEPYQDKEDSCLDSDDDWLDHDESSTLKLRDYQLELAEDALQGRNTIICAPTGSGKTWVALYIVKKHLAHAAAGSRKVIFMARTGALVKQQSDRFKRLLPDTKTKLITSDDEDSKKVGLFLEDYDIVCLTPQILINNFENKSIADLSLLTMLVLDECHHTKKDEPYNNLMRRCLVEKEINPKASLPQIVGLTASIGVGKSNTAQEACDYIVQMCARLDARIVSTVQRNLKQLEEISVNTADEVIQMQRRRDDPCKDQLMEVIEETEILLQDKALLQPVLTDLLCSIPDDKAGQEYQKWTIEIKKMAQHNLPDAVLSRNIQSCATYLYSYNAALEVNSLLQTKDVAHFLAEKNKYEEQHKNLTDVEKELLDNLKGVMRSITRLKRENPNVGVVVQTLKTMLEEKGEDSRAMVFVKQRATCKALAKFLDNAFRAQGVRAGDLFGKESRGSEDGMTEAVQNERIEKFRSGELKILVATSVGTEGIDIPDNNIVLSYNYSGNEITKTQIKGRIRKSGGTNVIMGSESLVEREKINAYKISLMHRGLKLFQQLDLKAKERKVALYQKEELGKYRQKKAIDEAKENRKRPDGELEIQCIRCQTKACMLSDVRCVERQHIVIDPDIKDRVNTTPHKSPKKYDGFHKKFKMWCKGCPLDWGIVAESKGMLCYTLKLSSFRFYKERSGESNTYKAWKDVPFAIPQINDVDLTRLLSHP